jgi:hypothetical protein
MKGHLQMTPDTQPGEVNGEEQRIAVQYAVSGDGIPAAELIQQWADKALQERSGSAELTVRVVDVVFSLREHAGRHI